VLECLQRVQRGRSAVLTYHGVITASSPATAYLDDNFPDADVFEQQIAYLAERYHPVSLSTLIACYQRNDAPPPNAVAVTFDDGFANNYTVAIPILQKYRVPFTVFLTTGLIGDPTAQLWTERVARALCLTAQRSVSLRLGNRTASFQLASQQARDDAARTVKSILKGMHPDQRLAALEAIEAACGRPALGLEDAERYSFLTWSQVRAMADAGVEFGSHTVTHPMLSTLSDRQLVAELSESKRRIEDETRRECFAFAYPNGSRRDFRPTDELALRDAGYRCAFMNEGGRNGIDEDMFALRRINIVRRFDRSMFQAALCGVLDAAGRLREMAVRVTGQASMPSASAARA
jgi:peptidoglycan/xylan/chitin deacetylase (PgdA/CDA1 family)